MLIQVVAQAAGEAGDLPVDLLRWLLALSPILLLLVLLVLFAALLLYRIGTAAGAFHALRVGVEHQSRNTIFLVLAFGWVFASFTQGIAGFGAPIAIVAPILVALRVRPVCRLCGGDHPARSAGRQR